MALSRRISDAQLLVVVIFVLSVLDLALLERKFDLFSGGFLLPERVVTFSARLMFCAAVVALETGMAGCVWYLLHIVGLMRNTAVGVTRYLFVVLYGGGSVVGLVAKYQILSYFGDFLSLNVLRNLGGGSLAGALNYGSSELLLFAAWLVPGITATWLSFRWMKRRLPAMKRPPNGSVGQLSLRLAACLGLLLGVSVAANANTVMRRYFPKITPFAIARSVLDDFSAREPSVLEGYAATVSAGTPAAMLDVGFGQRKDNLVLIVSESTRADVLGAEVDGKPVTPVWRALAAEGAAAPSYYSHTGFTTSSLKALFLGSLDRSRPMGGSLFEVLKREGYQIVVISGQDESFGDMARDTGQQVADIYFDARSAKMDRVFNSAAAGSLTLSNGRVVQEFEAIAGKIDWKRPVFFYINLQAAHFPYYHPNMPRMLESQPLDRGDISEEQKVRLKRTYHNAVAYSDWATGKIVSRIKQVGVYERTLVAVSADHGESLFDDGILGHGIRVTDSQLHALLLANRPLPAFSGVLAQSDLAVELLKGVGATVDGARRHTPVLELIGDPAMPAELGYMDGGQDYFVLNNLTGEIKADWLSRPMPVETIAPGSREQKTLLKLVADWKNQVRH
jgi:glucan phosphoethanolaminetransferase (alkaline phosphatase superfamily)